MIKEWLSEKKWIISTIILSVILILLIFRGCDAEGRLHESFNRSQATIKSLETELQSFKISIGEYIDITEELRRQNTGLREINTELGKYKRQIDIAISKGDGAIIKIEEGIDSLEEGIQQLP